MTDGPYFTDPDLANTNMRGYPNVVGDEEMCMYVKGITGSWTDVGSQDIVSAEINANFNTKINFSNDTLLEHAFICFINLTHKVTVEAILLQLDSYMLDVDGITIRCVSIY